MGGTTTVDGCTVTWHGHATVSVDGSVRVTVDPWNDVLSGDEAPADLVLVTHPHFDHYDAGAIDALAHDDTFVVLRGVEPAEVGDWGHEFVDIGHHDSHHGVEVEVIAAYNDHRFREEDVPFHPRDESCGYLFTVDGTRFYHAGDTDRIPEMDDLAAKDIDIAFLPIGGTYTMDVAEAVEAARAIEADVVIPIHYDHVDGTEADPERFRDLVETRTDSEVRIL